MAYLCQRFANGPDITVHIVKFANELLHPFVGWVSETFLYQCVLDVPTTSGQSLIGIVPDQLVDARLWNKTM